MSNHTRVFICETCDYTCAFNDPYAASAHTANTQHRMHRGLVVTREAPTDAHAINTHAFHVEDCQEECDQMPRTWPSMRPHEALLASGQVRRYHTRQFLIGEQTVGLHTFRAMALMVSLWKGHTHAALVALLTHDGAEGAVGDIPSPVKFSVPEVYRLLNSAEDAIMRHVGLGVTLNEEEARWVRICDLLEGAFFAVDQLRLGNIGIISAHNGYVRAINDLPMPREDRARLAEAYVRYKQGVRPYGVLMESLLKEGPALQQNHS